MLKLILWSAVIWFTTVTAFVATMHAKKLLATTGLSKFWKVGLLPAAVVGLAFDVLFFNYVLGTLTFLELPRLREPTFSARVQRWYLKGDRRAKWWAARLNEIDASHIHEARE